MTATPTRKRTSQSARVVASQQTAEPELTVETHDTAVDIGEPDATIEQAFHLDCSHFAYRQYASEASVGDEVFCRLCNRERTIKHVLFTQLL